MNNNYITHMPFQTIAFGAIAGNYVAIDSDGVPGPLKYFHIINETDAPLYFSYDGVNDHIYVVNDREIDIYFQLCKSPNNKVSILKKGTIIYVRSDIVVPTTGFVVVNGFY